MIGTCIGVGDLEGPALTALYKLTINGDIPSMLPPRRRSLRAHTIMEGAALHSLLLTIEVIAEEDDVEDLLANHHEGPMAMQTTLDIMESTMDDILQEPRNRRKAVKSPKWDEWRTAEQGDLRTRAGREVLE